MRKIATLPASIFALMGAMPAMAQSDSSTSAIGLETVIVTARKIVVEAVADQRAFGRTGAGGRTA